MSYLVLARKWRPQRFADVVGQAHVTKTLINAIEMDRVAHAFLFAGVRGVGKTSLARILAKSLNCKDGPTANPCGTCDSCRAVTAGTSVDVIEIDGASNNSVEDIRNLRETVPFRPTLGKFKVYVIDEVHMLSTSAFNALLKTLEEPPPHVKFIFATTESHKIPVTILSRCQRYDFRRIPSSAVIERLKEILTAEKVAFDPGALTLIGREAEGSMRDALSTLDQVLAASGDRITAESVADILGVVERQVFYDLSATLLGHDARRCLEILQETDRQGYDMTTFAKGLLEHLRNLVVAGVCKGERTVLDLADDEFADLSAQAISVSADTLHRLFKHFSEAYESIVRSSHPKILLETALARIADLGDLVPAQEILARLDRLAAGGPGSSGGGGVSGGGAAFGGRGAPTSGAPSAGPNRNTLSGASPSAFAAPAEPASVPSRAPAPSPQRGIPATAGPVSAPPQSAPPPSDERAFPPPPQSAPPPGEDAFVSPQSGSASDADGAPVSGERWQQMVEEMKQEKPAMASILEYARIEPVPRGVAFLFSKEYGSIAGLAKDRVPEMAVHFQNRLGRDVAVEIRVVEGSGTPSGAKRRIEEENQRREKEDRALQHPLIRQIQSEFGAKVAGVRIMEDSSQSGASR